MPAGRGPAPGLKGAPELAAALGLGPRQGFLLDGYRRVLGRIGPEGAQRLLALVNQTDLDLKGQAISRSVTPLLNLTTALCRGLGPLRIRSWMRTLSFRVFGSDTDEDLIGTTIPGGSMPCLPDARTHAHGDGGSQVGAAQGLDRRPGAAPEPRPHPGRSRNCIRRTTSRMPQDIIEALVAGRNAEAEGSRAANTLDTMIENIQLADDHVAPPVPGHRHRDLLGAPPLRLLPARR